jgi:hypothetical protein
MQGINSGKIRLRLLSVPQRTERQTIENVPRKLSHTTLCSSLSSKASNQNNAQDMIPTQCAVLFDYSLGPYHTKHDLTMHPM